MGNQLKLGDVRRVFRLVGEIRELGADPERWRPHMVQALRRLANAEVVVSSEIHFRKIKTTGAMIIAPVVLIFRKWISEETTTSAFASRRSAWTMCGRQRSG